MNWDPRNLARREKAHRKKCQGNRTRRKQENNARSRKKRNLTSFWKKRTVRVLGAATKEGGGSCREARCR